MTIPPTVPELLTHEGVNRWPRIQSVGRVFPA
nr:MAG TPA: hypothetical protein [Caudoviricetes sp.]